MKVSKAQGAQPINKSYQIMQGLMKGYNPNIRSQTEANQAQDILQQGTQKAFDLKKGETPQYAAQTGYNDTRTINPGVKALDQQLGGRDIQRRMAAMTGISNQQIANQQQALARQKTPAAQAQTPLVKTAKIQQGVVGKPTFKEVNGELVREEPSNIPLDYSNIGLGNIGTNPWGNLSTPVQSQTNSNYLNSTKAQSEENKKQKQAGIISGKVSFNPYAR